jgi:peptide/nickel transport system ATP-binding protein
VQLPQAARRLDAYPHQLSGGQRQRVVIAIALACRPDLLIADEPTTALDVTVQREVLALIAELVAEDGMALLLISHDLGVMAQQVRRLLVMYGGQGVEGGPTAEVFRRMSHPYTRGLFAARPRLGLPRGTRLATIPGRVPELADLGAGCAFAERCAWAEAACRSTMPAPTEVGRGSCRALPAPGCGRHRVATPGGCRRKPWRLTPGCWRSVTWASVMRCRGTGCSARRRSCRRWRASASR